MENLDYTSGDKIAKAIDNRIINVSKEVFNNSPYNKTKYGTVLSKKDGVFSVKIDRNNYSGVTALRNVGDINVGEVVTCLIPNNNFNNIIILGVADGSLKSGGSGGDITVIDNLSSTSATDALSANQGRILKSIADNKQDPLTSSQLQAVNSGITNNDVSQINTNKNNISTINTAISGYGDIVTHNVNEFATRSQGIKADTALQPGDNISELTNDSGFTKTEASNINGNIKINNIETNVYSLPNEVLKEEDVVNNTTSSQTNKPLSANIGKELQDQINNLKSRGRYLSIWNCITGLAQTTPTVDPYTYRAGDYFIVGVVDKASQYLEYDSTKIYNLGDKCSYNNQYYICNTNNTTGVWDSNKWIAHTIVNYRPNGATYSVSTPSTTIETGDVKVNDTYYYDGTYWTLLDIGQVAGTFGSLGGSPYDNSNLAEALNSKQSLLNIAQMNAVNSGINSTLTGKITTNENNIINLQSNKQNNINASNKLNADYVSDANSTNKFVTQSDKNAWDSKQNAISDLGTIRSGAALGATAVQPSGVGNGTLTITQGGVSRGTFTANQSGNTTVELDKELFYCTYGTTTNAQITQALNQNKLPICITAGLVYKYSATVGTTHYFTTAVSNTVYTLYVTSASNYQTSTNTIQTVNNGTLTITQGGVSKGTFSANQSGNTTVALDGGVIWEEY